MLDHKTLPKFDDSFVWKDGNDPSNLSNMMKQGTRLNELKWQA